MRQLSGPANVVFLDLTPNWRVFGFIAAVTASTALCFGIVPATRASRVNPDNVLKEQGRGVPADRSSRVGGMLVGAQVALSLVLVVFAGLFIRTFVGLSWRDIGFMPDRVLVVTVTAPTTEYTLPKLVSVYERVLEMVEGVPGVERAAMSDITPVGGGARIASVEVAGGSIVPESDRITSVNVISPGWFSTYGMRIIVGRDFQSSDRPDTVPVAIVNQEFARRFLDGNPIGDTVSVAGGATLQVVGLVNDAVYRTMRDAAPPTMYTATTQRVAARSYVHVSVLPADGSPVRLSRNIAAVIRDIDPNLSLQFRPLNEQMDAAVSQERLAAALFGFFGALSLLLSSLGLYGITAYAVTRRRSEIGLRMALGAPPHSVIRLVLRRITIVVAVGIGVGAGLSLWAARFVGTLLWGLGPWDPTTFAGAAVVLAFVATFASSLPAWRASRIDPAIVLRD
jgi:predicted permease